MRGSIFVSFIALILISQISQIMARKDLFEVFSKAEMFKILNKLKIFQLANSKNLLSEISKKQKLIFSAFGISKIDQPSYNSTEF